MDVFSSAFVRVAAGWRHGLLAQPEPGLAVAAAVSRRSARRHAPSSSSRSRWPSTSQTTSKGCSATVRADHRCPAIPYALAGPSSSTARMRCAPPPVFGETPAHERARDRRQGHRDRSAAGPSGIDAVRRRLARYWIRARGREPVGLCHGHDLGVRRDAGQQVIADERGGALLVDKQRVGRAVARPRQDPKVAPAGPDRCRRRTGSVSVP